MSGRNKKPKIGAKGGLPSRTKDVVASLSSSEMMAKPYREPINYDSPEPPDNQGMPQPQPEEFQQRGHHAVNYAHYDGQIPPNEQENRDEDSRGVESERPEVPI